MQKILLPLFGFAVLFSSCSEAPVKPEGSGARPRVQKEGRFEVIPSFGSFKIRRAPLPNGLKLLVLHDPSSPTFAYQTWFNVGSRNEVPGKTGLAHLFEHMMFKGTTHHKEGEFDALLEQAGAEGENAFTSNDHTVYVQELPDSRFDLITELEADRMVNLIVNDSSFKTEREVVQNERRFRKENSPEGTMYQTLFETAFTTHPYHWPVIGYEQDLNVMGAQDARDFYERFYSPERATIVVVGNIDPDTAYSRIEKTYGHIKPRNTPDAPLTAEPEQTAQRRKRLELNVEVEKLWVAFKIPGINSQDSPIFEAIQGLLTEGKNGRLNRALTDAGIAASVDSGSLSHRDPGLFLIEVDLQKGKSALLAESVLMRELERLKLKPVSQEELKRATNVMRFRFLEHVSTASGKARFFGQAETDLGSVERGLELQNKVYEVTPEQVQTTLQKYFNSSSMTIVVAVPKKKS
jgi:zinc protease